jgi:ATP-dependent DNA helicase DinG
MSAESVRKALAAAVEAIGGSQRAGQIAMAEAVANALEDRHHLLVQAGTGTGKSLAYLVPALVHGKRVLVATATLALQRQLIERDLPKVQKALEKELGRNITFAVYKGVGNYLCLQKMNADDSGVDSQVLVEISSLESDARRLRQWASRHLDESVWELMNVALERNVLQ